MNTELLPCPFCGGRALMVEGKYQAPGKYSVICGVCFCCTTWFDKEENAIETWNRRAKNASK